MIPRNEWRRLCLSLCPSVLLVLIGGLTTIMAPIGAAIALGGGIAFVLSFMGGLIIAATNGQSLPVAAFASLASFIIRIGGAGIAALIGQNHPHATWLLASLATGLILTLLIDLLTWARIATATTAPVTPAKESARA
jgi:hypothetical protein